MGLRTRVWLSGPIDGKAAFKLAIAAVMRAAGRDAETTKIRTTLCPAGEPPAWLVARIKPEVLAADPALADPFIEPFDAISTELDQGLPAVIRGRFHADNAPLTVTFGDEGEHTHICQVEVSWETSYGYCAKDLDSTGLHAVALCHLAVALPDGVTLRWRNEYTGVVYDGVTADALTDFAGTGKSPATWRPLADALLNLPPHTVRA